MGVYSIQIFFFVNYQEWPSNLRESEALSLIFEFGVPELEVMINH